tara:strand:- start:8650 stop:9348 length:699 start_codon:yes stop_codon:yes gene_type:complete
MNEDREQIGIFKKDILEYLKKENGKVKRSVRYYSQDPKRKPEDHPYRSEYKFDFPLNNQTNDTGLRLIATLAFDFNEKEVRVSLAGIHYKEKDSGYLEMDKYKLYTLEDFKNIEKKVISFIDFLDIEVPDSFFYFNREGLLDGRWYESFTVGDEDFTGSELLDRKCLPEVISDCYEFNEIDRKKLNVVLKNEKLFLKLIQGYHTFNYKKVFSEMDTFKEEEWSEYIELNYGI